MLEDKTEASRVKENGVDKAVSSRISTIYFIVNLQSSLSHVYA